MSTPNCTPYLTIYHITYFFPTMFGIIDCNNFFVSCERVFRPWLKGMPVVVLSNNDGCVVARSNEAKAMDIAMGTPFFKVRHLVESG